LQQRVGEVVEMSQADGLFGSDEKSITVMSSGNQNSVNETGASWFQSIRSVLGPATSFSQPVETTKLRLYRRDSELGEDVSSDQG
jgi:hypothetical protein